MSESCPIQVQGEPGVAWVGISEEDYSEIWDGCNDFQECIERTEKVLKSKNVGKLKDAERYRWLKQQDNDDFSFSVVKNPHFDVFEGNDLDAAIDAQKGQQ